MSHMTAVGIRELKNNLSQYVRRIEKGEKFAITAHGRVVAELGPAGRGRRRKATSRYEELVAAGVIRPALEEGDPIPDDGMRICLPAGTVQELIDWGRGED
ncbi:MAG: type II toxin-antitoxin system prevent-host-death family antitoxin [Acidobacteriota bacterium]|nr:type II toxin-antitoxin system prevent-host-death family antitoxin [Acidobacteriota bacterium]